MLRTNRIAVAIVALGIGAGPALASGPLLQSAADLILANATVVDPASDLALQGATVVVANGRIRQVSPGPVVAPEGARVLDLEGAWLLPGLIDAHVHISSISAARTALESGVTTARSMGTSNFADVGLRELAAAGRIEAPEILAAGYHVRPGPAEGLFLDFPHLGDLVGGEVHGPESIRRVVRAMLERQVDFIKTNATERAGLPTTDPRKQLYSEEELSALVDEAAAVGVPVAAHAHGDGGGRAAVLAGVRSIEHGTYLSDETLALMAERGTFLVPTIAIVGDVAAPGGDYDDPVLQIRGRHMLPRVRETATKARAAGVPLVAATDTGYGSGSVVRMPDELVELVGIGLSPLEAIRAATTTAAELLGVDDHAGRIAPGFDADLIAVERSPLDDIGVLHDLLLVVNDGRVVVDRLSWSAAAPAAIGTPR